VKKNKTTNAFIHFVSGVVFFYFGRCSGQGGRKIKSQNKEIRIKTKCINSNKAA